MTGRIAHMKRGALRIVVEDYGWVHLGIGMIGNAVFIAASAMFLASGNVVLPIVDIALVWNRLGRWFFIIGSTLMFIGSLGELLVSLYNRRRKRRQS